MKQAYSLCLVLDLLCLSPFLVSYSRNSSERKRKLSTRLLCMYVPWVFQEQARVAVQAQISCEDPVFFMNGIGERQDYLDPYYFERPNMPTCAVDGGTTVHDSEDMWGFWMELIAPGAATDSYAMNIQTVEGYGSKFAVFKGSCSDLLCEDTVQILQDSDTEGRVQWNAVGGTTYRIYANSLWTTDAQDYLPVRVNMANPFNYCELVEKPRYLSDSYFQASKISCECVDQGDTKVRLKCNNDCTDCYTDNDGTEYCTFFSFEDEYEQVWGGVTATVTFSCWELADGYARQGEEVCMMTDHNDANVCQLSLAEPVAPAANKILLVKLVPPEDQLISLPIVTTSMELA